MRILIVEDEMIISEDMAGMLEDSGYTVVGQAIDFDEAISMIESEKPDLVLLDINLQGEKDGIDVAERLNEIVKIPFIYSSSLGDQGTVGRAKKTNPSAYLVKPFKEEQLIAAIEIAMSNFAISGKRQADEEKLTIFNDAIFIKDGQRFTKLRLANIVYVSKSDNYIDIHTTDARYIVRSSISGFLDQVNFPNLFRTHKSYAVNLHFVTDVNPNTIKLGEIEIPLAKTYADALKSQLRIF